MIKQKLNLNQNNSMLSCAHYFLLMGFSVIKLASEEKTNYLKGLVDGK